MSADATVDRQGAIVSEGDVVQVAPGSGNGAFSGCFVIVTECRGWGVIGDAVAPGAGTSLVYPYRCESKDFERVGVAPFGVPS